MDEIGKPTKFDIEKYCDVVEMMIESDELIRALWMCDNPPGFYREFKSERLEQIRKDLYKQTVTVKDYINDKDEYKDGKAEEIIDTTFTYPRYDVLAEYLSQLNLKGIIPNIYEACPASFWLPKMLRKAELQFQYDFMTINPQAEAKFNKEWLCSPIDQKQPWLFVCFETLEHLWNTQDILHIYIKAGIDAQAIFLSTPLNTLCGGHPDKWSTRELGHLQTFTQQEFIEFAYKNFPGRQWEYTRAQMGVLVGEKI